MDLLKTAIQEAQDFYRIYRKTAPYIRFTNFLESLERDDNKALIESVKRGVNTLLENVRDALKNLDPEYARWISEGDKLINSDQGKSIVANAQKNPKDDKNKMILLKSVLPAMARYVDDAMKIWDVYTEKGESEGDDVAEEAMKQLTTYVFEELIPKYDPKLGNKFFTFVASHLKPASQKGGNKARDTVRTILRVPRINDWVPESKRGQKYTYEKQKTGMVSKGKVRHNGKVYTRLGPDKIIPDGLGEVPPDDERVVDKYWIEAPSEDMSKFRESKYIEGDKADEEGGTETSGSTDMGKVDLPAQKSQLDEIEEDQLGQQLNKVISSSGIKDANLVNYLKDYYTFIVKEGMPDKNDHVEIAKKNNFDLTNNSHNTALTRARQRIKENAGFLKG